MKRRALRPIRSLISLLFGRGLEYRRGGVALIMIVASPMLIGSVGFATDAAYWYSQQAALQTATDAAAMKAARDLASTPNTTTLDQDAMAAAQIATQQSFNFTSFTVHQLDDNRQVEVDASIPGLQFLSNALNAFKISTVSDVTIHASSIAGVAYTAVSNQATCYSADSYTYLFSTGLGMINTAHSSGVDPYQCGGAIPAPPSSYQAFCNNGAVSGNGGVLGCNLDLLNIGVGLLPFAILIGPTPSPALSNYNTVIAPVLDTLGALQDLLNSFSGYGTAAMTVLGNGTTPQYCSYSVCTLPSGTYDGGVTIPAGLTVTFAKGNFNIENGDFIVSNQATLTNNALLYFGGTAPGGLVQTTQLQFNTAAIKSGAVTVNSQANFTSNSLVGTQTSSPISALKAVETAEANDLLASPLNAILTPLTYTLQINAQIKSGLTQTSPLAFLGLPAGNVVGTNFIAVNATCPTATSVCNSTDVQIQTPATAQYTAIPSLSGTVTSLLAKVTSLVGLGNIPVIALLTSNEGETSHTTIQSALTLDNGVPTSWWQQETTNSTMTNLTQNIAGVLAYLGIKSGSLLATLVSGTLQTVMNALTALGLQSPGTANAAYANSGLFPGQSEGAPAGSGSCAFQPTLYSKTITPGFTSSYSDLLNSGGSNNPNGVNGSLTASDTITICGSFSGNVASISPLDSSTPINTTTAAGSSTLVLIP